MKSLIHKPLSLITKTRIRGLDAFTTPTPHDGTRPGVVRGRQQRNVEIRSAEMGSIWDGLGTLYRVSYLTGIDGDLAELRSPSSARWQVP